MKVIVRTSRRRFIMSITKSISRSINPKRKIPKMIEFITTSAQFYREIRLRLSYV